MPIWSYWYRRSADEGSHFYVNNKIMRGFVGYWTFFVVKYICIFCTLQTHRKMCTINFTWLERVSCQGMIHCWNICVKPLWWCNQTLCVQTPHVRSPVDIIYSLYSGLLLERHSRWWNNIEPALAQCLSCHPASTRPQTSSVLLLGHVLLRWPSIKTTLDQRIVFADSGASVTTPSRHTTLNQCWFKAGPPSATLDQR